MAKATPLADAMEIRRLYKTGKYSHGDLSRMFQKHVMTIGRICRGETIVKQLTGNAKDYDVADTLKMLNRLGGITEPAAAELPPLPTMQDKVNGELNELLNDALKPKCEDLNCQVAVGQRHLEACSMASSDVIFNGD